MSEFKQEGSQAGVAKTIGSGLTKNQMAQEGKKGERLSQGEEEDERIQRGVRRLGTAAKEFIVLLNQMEKEGGREGECEEIKGRLRDIARKNGSLTIIGGMKRREEGEDDSLTPRQVISEEQRQGQGIRRIMKDGIDVTEEYEAWSLMPTEKILASQERTLASESGTDQSSNFCFDYLSVCVATGDRCTDSKFERRHELPQGKDLNQFQCKWVSAQKKRVLQPFDRIPLFALGLNYDRLEEAVNEKGKEAMLKRMTDEFKVGGKYEILLRRQLALKIIYEELCPGEQAGGGNHPGDTAPKEGMMGSPSTPLALATVRAG